jgi:hypothetical protein
MSTPIDLQKEYGHRWKIGLDEAARGRRTNLWNLTIVCRHGEICPWGDDLLAASTANAGAVANRLRALPFVEVVHDGSDGVTAVFQSRYLQTVAGIMKPRRARKACPAQLAALDRGRVRLSRHT